MSNAAADPAPRAGCSALRGRRLRRAPRGLIVLLVWLAAISALPTVSACKCPRQLVCESYWKSDAVFLGTVTDIAPRDHEQLVTELKQLMVSLGLGPEDWPLDESELTDDQRWRALQWRKDFAIRNGGRRLPDEVRALIDEAGSLQAISEIMNEHAPPRRWVSLKVGETLRGEAVGVVEISTGFGGGDCGYPFEIGGEYLVFADRQEATDSLATGICTATATATDSRETLEWIRGRESAPPGGQILGDVRGFVFDPYANRELRIEPLRDVPVVLDGPGGSRTVLSDAAGNFLFDQLPPGGYRVAAQLAGFALRQPVFDVNVVDRGCIQVNFFGEPIRGSIRGRLFQHDGQPLAGIEVEAVAANSPDRGSGGRAKTWLDGTFEIKHLLEGDYLVGVNVFNAPTARRGGQAISGPQPSGSRPFPRIYYPGTDERRKALLVHLAPGGIPAPAEWRMPEPLEERTIEGAVLWPEDSGITGGTVTITAEGFKPSSARSRFGAEGRFELVALKGIAYEVEAMASRGEKRYRAAAKLSENESGQVVLILKSAERTYVVK